MGKWIQLRCGVSHDPLKRGWWYPVLDRMKEGMVRASLNGGFTVVHITQVRLIDHEPETATRLRPITLVEMAPEEPVVIITSSTAICPRNHELEEVSTTDDQVECQRCGRTYPIEEELPIGPEPQD